MMALHRRMDIEMLKKHAARACVFSKNQVCFLKSIHSPKRHILQIPHRRRHNIQHNFSIY